MLKPGAAEENVVRAAICDQMVAKFSKLLENYFFFDFSDSLFLEINKSVLGFSVRLLGHL